MSNQLYQTSWFLPRWGFLFSVLLLTACAGPTENLATKKPVLYQNLESPASRLDLQNAQQVISTYRRSKGLGPVTIDPDLTRVAQGHANAQAKADKIGHSVGGSFPDRIRRLKQRRGASVENVGAGYRSFAQAFSGWRNSKGHNTNLLNKKVTRLGIAKAVNSKSKFKVFWTLIMTSDPL